VHYLFLNPCAWWQQRIGRRYITRVTDNVKVTYAATESEVINTKGALNFEPIYFRTHVHGGSKELEEDILPVSQTM
jgi:hypothetical protein